MKNLKLKVEKTITLHEGNFLKYCRTYFTDKTNKKKSWEFVVRQNENRAAVVYAHSKEKIILVKQFRVPLKAFTLEFPAGLIDKGESPADCAIRELKEETGYAGKVILVSPPVCTSPGLSGESIYFVEMEITGPQSIQNLDDTEEIDVLEFSKKNLKEEITVYLKQNNDVVLDSKVWGAFFI